MTNPIPGADSERAAFEAWAKAACEIPFYAAINWNAVWTKAAWEGWQARAAAKVGANVAADWINPEYIRMRDGTLGNADFLWSKAQLADDAVIFQYREFLFLRQLLANFRDGLGARVHAMEALVRMDAANIATHDLRRAIAAGAPAETPKPIVECPRYDFGCGRIESLWCDNCPERTTQPSPAPIAGDVEKDAWTTWELCQACVKTGFGPLEAQTLLNNLEAARAAMLANSSPTTEQK